MARSEIEYGGEGSPIAWTIPAARSKNRRAHLIPLSPLAREIVREALGLPARGPFVFPSRTNRGHFDNTALAAGCRDCRPLPGR